MTEFGPVRIGDVEIAHPFVQAALSGYSDLAMRRLARAHGAGYTINEVVLGKSLLHESDWQRQILDVAPDDHPVGGQLMGANPDDFGPAATLLADAGYDIIDINFGCPVPKAIDGCRGGYLLSDPDHAERIVAAVVNAVGDRRPVTVKMRRGLDDSPESRRCFFEILDRARRLGVRGVTVHGRTVEQKYRGPSRWAFLADVKRHVGDDLVVLGSGDLFSADACVRMIRETGVDGVTIARGALGNPWIFRQCLALARGEDCPAEPTLAEQAATIRQHLALAEPLHGHKTPRHVAKCGMRYSRFHPTPKRVREAFQQVATHADLLAVLAEYYGGSPVPDSPAVSARSSG